MRAEKKSEVFKDPLFLRFRSYVRWTIALCISRELHNNDLDYKQLANLMNRSPALMYKFLGGRSNLTIDTIAEIAYVGKIPIKNAFGFYSIEKSFEILFKALIKIIELTCCLPTCFFLPK